MLKAIFNWFTGKPLPGTEAPKVSPEAVPYKVEAPVVAVTSEPTPVPAADVAPQPVKCGCGRSPTGFCTGLHKLSQAEWEAQSGTSTKPTRKKPAAIKAAPKKPAAKKTPKK